MTGGKCYFASQSQSFLSMVTHGSQEQGRQRTEDWENDMSFNNLLPPARSHIPIVNPTLNLSMDESPDEYRTFMVYSPHNTTTGPNCLL